MHIGGGTRGLFVGGSMQLLASGATFQSPDNHHKFHPLAILRPTAPERRIWRCASLSNSLGGRKTISWEVQEPQPLSLQDEPEEEPVLGSGKISGRRSKAEVLPPHQDPNARLENWQGEVPFGYALKDGNLIKDSGCMQHGVRWYILRVAGRQQKHVVEYLEGAIPKLPPLKDENGDVVARQYSVWAPQKRIRAWNPRLEDNFSSDERPVVTPSTDEQVDCIVTKKMGRRTVDYVTAPRVLLECTMDNHMFNLIKDYHYIIGFVNMDMNMDWVPQPCETSEISDIWDWLWKNDDIDEAEYLRRLEENEYGKFGLGDGEVNEGSRRDIVDIVELLTMGKNVGEHLEEHMKAKAEREEKRRERILRRSRKGGKQRRPKFGRADREAGRERSPASRSKKYGTRSVPSSGGRKGRNRQEQRSSYNPRDQKTSLDYDAPWQKWDEPPPSQQSWGGNLTEEDGIQLKRDESTEAERPLSSRAAKKQSSSGRSKTSDVSWRSKAPIDNNNDLDMTSFFLDQPTEHVELKDDQSRSNVDPKDFVLELDDLDEGDLSKFSASINNLTVVNSSDNQSQERSSSIDAMLDFDEPDSLAELDSFFGSDQTEATSPEGNMQTDNREEATEKTRSGTDLLPEDVSPPADGEMFGELSKVASHPDSIEGMPNEIYSPVEEPTQVDEPDKKPSSASKGIHEQMEEQSVEIEDGSIAAGNSVFVTNGPFKDFDGKVISVGKGGAMQVELDVFGRPTVVEIEDTALEKK